MEENVTTSKNPPHRPEKPIDWKIVDQLLLAGCTGAECAAHFDMHHDTFYDRVQKQHGKSFTAYASERYQKGESLLRTKQFEKALEKDNTMLIWLGKQRLGQRDEKENKESLQLAVQEIKNLLASLMAPPKLPEEGTTLEVEHN